MKLNSLRKVTGGLSALRRLFMEVLQLTPPDMASKVAEAYRQGKSVMLVMGHSEHDRCPMENKTALRWAILDNDSWRSEN